mmetsp:Transcript_37086/g.122342  ORF Transcript_37086/g.122342 Transcript_37086/m.122342 type:complete len:703 (+) Transcript_37086:41-2149(+)
MRSSESDSDVSSGEAVTESGDTDDLGGLLDSLEGISLHQPREDGVPVQSGDELPPFRFAVPAVQLRDYQASLLAAVRDRFSEGHGSVLAYLPTGGGKTHVAAAECASELAAGGRCLLLVNSRTLLEQTRRAFIKVGFGSELVGLVGGSSALQLERPVQVAMIQSLHGRTLEQHARWLRRFSLAVVDEAHAAFAHTYASLLRRLGESCRVLGVTATPFRSSPEERLEQVFTGAAFGPSISTLIDRRLLVRPTVYGGPPPRAGGTAAPFEAEVDAIIAKYRARARGVRAVAFCARVADSKLLAARMAQAGIAAAHLDGDTSAAERESLFDRMREGSLHVLCNCDVLCEGFDLPEVGAVLLLRPTRSRRLYIQQVGRALRAAKGKEGCVVLDFAGLTWRFGPVTGPPLGASEVYAWEEACGTAASARALVRRCRCGVLSHAAEAECGACGELFRSAAVRAAQSSCLASLSSSRAGLAAQPARHSAGQGGASRPVGQGEPSRALASAALPLGRSKHSAPEAKPQQPRAAAQQMPKPRPASAPLPIAAASPPPQTELHLRPASASSAARTPLADVRCPQLNRAARSTLAPKPHPPSREQLARSAGLPAGGGLPRKGAACGPAQGESRGGGRPEAGGAAGEAEEEGEEEAPAAAPPLAPPAGWVKVFHERRQRHVYINEETGEMASTPPSGEACANALAAAVEALRVA